MLTFIFFLYYCYYYPSLNKECLCDKTEDILHCCKENTVTTESVIYQGTRCHVF